MHESVNKPVRGALQGLLPALGLSLALLVLSYLRIAGDSQSLKFRDNVLDSMMAGQVLGTTLSLNLIKFGLAVLLLHLLFGCACWMVARLSMRAYGTAKASPNQQLLLWFIVLTVGVLATNAAHFPRSSLGEHYASVMISEWGPLRLGSWIGLAAGAAALLTVLLGSLRTWRSGEPAARLRIIVPAAAVGVFALFTAWPQGGGKLAPNDKPNVILIGLDSLRADLVAPETSPHVTPVVAEFLKNGTWFSDATTPLARTFPSMTSILTGRQPHRTGAVNNLLPRDLVHEGDTLGRILQRAGYRAIYATDEVRFSNIDQSYGFDQAITPPIGASEFLITLLGDTPVSNLVVNTTLGRWLFPHLHANRGAAVTYDPDEFVARVGREAQLSQPFLLITHLTLSHWPYYWADAPLNGPKNDDKLPDFYLNAARRIDRQLGDMLAMLEARGALENAIVIVYSDHGEAFGTESLTPENDPLIASLNATPHWGHGDSVISPHQYRVVLGMRGYGPMARRIAVGSTVTAPVTVMDIAPTIVALTDARTDTKFDGQSMAPLLAGNAGPDAAAFASRVRFTETEYSPSNVATQDGKVSASGLRAAMRIYRIDPKSDRIEVKRELTHGLLEGRQYAAIGDKLLLAAIPTGGTKGLHQFLVIDLAGGPPERVPGTPDENAPPELRELWKAMYAEFGAVLPPEAPPSTVANPAVASRGQ